GIPWHLTPPTHHRGPTATWTALFPTQLRPHRLLSATQTSNKTCFPLLTALCGCQSLCAKAWAPFWPRQGAPPPLGKGRGRRQWAGAGAGGGLDRGGLSRPPLATAPPTPGLPPSPPISVRPASSCCSRAFTVSASSRPLFWPGMATPTQAPTNVPQEPDPFYYDYDTVQTVGMTLATIFFLLGIFIIISKCNSPGSKTPQTGLPRGSPGTYSSLVGFRPDPYVLSPCSISLLTGKKVKCRKEDSRSESPTCKSCKSELPSSAPGGGGV
uniref:FXYD domain-containing ion transport regulator n=2 Tax=Rhinolophus ferrumequinum TaxID=59479 RepID=A0A671EKV9_RHIFE